MTGSAKWLVVASVVVLAVSALIALALFAWMLFESPMMGSVNTTWGASHMGRGALGWMGSWADGRSMMDSTQWQGEFPGMGMMGGSVYGNPQSGNSAAAQALTIEQAQARLEEYLAGREGLEIAEIMIFDNHAYAEIVETETGVGAMELLVDPETLSVFPEPGPNMMWNLKYGHMRGAGMMGASVAGGASADMTVSPEEAVELAQTYLDRYLPGFTADEHADPFYGYYTIHTLQDGVVAGMLSVNGFSGTVFLHTWHGTLLEMTEADHD